MPLSAKPYGDTKFATVNGKRMAYLDTGDEGGDTIVFQHGNPTSSYLWRNIMPHCEGLGRLVACDLIGMGGSDKLEESGPDRYTYGEQRDYLFALWDQLALGSRVVLVLHDWGSALGFDWARRNAGRVKGIVYMESIVQPLTWDDWPENARRVFQNFRTDAGEPMILEKNVFVERVLPSSVLRPLSEAEMAVYRAPFAAPGEDRRPTLTWPRQIPIDGEPADVVAVVNGICRMAGRQRPAEAVRQCGAGIDPHRAAARLLPHLAEPDRGDRQGQPLHPGRQPRRDRRGHCGLGSDAWLRRGECYIQGHNFA